MRPGRLLHRDSVLKLLSRDMGRLGTGEVLFYEMKWGVALLVFKKLYLRILLTPARPFCPVE